MAFAPESQIILVNAAILAVAYLVVYPSLKNLTANRMMAIDGGLSGLSLAIAGSLFMGTGVPFSLLLFSTNWAIFSIVSMLVMEMPLFYWFCRQRGIGPFGPDD